MNLFCADPTTAQEDIATNNWDGTAALNLKKWLKRIMYYIKVEVEDDVILETPGDHQRNLFYFPGADGFNLLDQAISYEIVEFHGALPLIANENIPDAIFEKMCEFLDIPIEERIPDDVAEKLFDFLSVFALNEEEDAVEDGDNEEEADEEAANEDEQ